MSLEKDRLYLSKITLQNYRTYKGKHSIEFSSDKKQPITVIHGTSGNGKTTLLNSMVWALYGKERTEAKIIVLDGTSSTNEGIVNKHTLDMVSDIESETFVELRIYDNEGLLYIIRRSIMSKKNHGMDKLEFNETNNSVVPRNITFSTKLLFQYRGENNSQMETIDNEKTATIQIKNIFPEILSPYVFFDGELLNQFLFDTEKKLVRDGIEQISGLPVLKDTVEMLGRTKDDITKDLGAEDARLGTLVQSKEHCYKQKKECEGKIEDLKKQISYDEIKFKKIAEFLEKSSEKAVKERMQEYEKLEEDGKNILDRLKIINKEFKEFIFDHIHNLHLNNTIKNVEITFQKYQEDGSIPPVISKIALEDLLRITPSKCICGRGLDAGSAERKRIEEMKNKIIDSTIIQEITRGRDRLALILENSTQKKLKGEFDSHNIKLSAVRNDLRNNTSAKKTIDDYVITHKDETVRAEGIKRDDIKRKIYEAYGDLGVCETGYTWADNKLIELDIEIEKISKQVAYQKSIMNKIKLCKIASKILKNLHDQLSDDFRDIVEKSTNEYFLKIVPRRQDFKGIKILPNFQTRAIDSSGKYKKLSMGQSHCLGLSYIAAIREITKQNYFIVIDSPLHNISQKAKTDIAKILPKYLGETQLTLLVTDQEYLGEVIKPLDGEPLPSVQDVLIKDQSLGKQYILKISEGDEKDRTTQIVESKNE